MRFSRFSLLATAAASWLLLAPTALADEQVVTGDEPNKEAANRESSQKKPAPAAATYFDQVTVVGGTDKLAEIPGSAHQLSRAELEQQDHSDIHRVLRTVPGVNVQEEEGYGLRPNIGMRGTGVERSSKITLLEDGILIAPAPYAAPAAYYFPVVGRMEMIEVRKGSSSIRQGPYTTGGVLNFISTSIPPNSSGRVSVSGGDDSTLRLHANVGDSGSRFGWMVETYQLRTDGFKKLDGSGGNSGFELQDYIAKFRFNSSAAARRQQAFELKLGYTTQDGSETYVGLTEEDFHRTPYRRYAGSGKDVISTEHEQYQVRHFLQLTPSVDVTSTVYRNEFSRNWYKLDSVNGLAVARILESPQEHSAALALLRGEADDLTGALRLRNNRRSYYSAGVQSTVTARYGTRVRHELEFGARYHQDEEDRFQEDDRYGISGGEMMLVSRGTPGSNANRIGHADALSLFVEDEMQLGRWTITPGARLESIELLQRDFGRRDAERTGAELSTKRNSLDVVIPGFGVHYRLSPTIGVFAGVHKGFAPPGPGSDEKTEPEKSVNYELGMRRLSNKSNLTLVGFFNDYTNLLGKDTLSSGGTGTGDLFNGGAVEVSGLEFSYGDDLETLLNWNMSLPIRFAYTFTDAEFQTSFETSFEDWAPHVEKGDELPYLPRHQWGASVGASRTAWSVFVNLSYGDEMRTTPGRGAASERTDEFFVADLALDYKLPRGVKLLAQVRNLADVTYIAARRPAGLRPGLPRTALLGLEWSF